MTRNTLQRLSLFVAGIPAFVAVVLFLPFARNAVLVAVILVIQALGARELAGIHKAGELPIKPVPSMIAAAFNGLAVYAACLASGRIAGFPGPAETLALSSAITSLFLLSPAAFAKPGDFPEILRVAGARSLIHMYTGVFGSFFVLITSSFPRTAAPILTFTLLTFGNDSLAWLFGVTLGKRRNIVAVSPKKSLAGFVGGLSGSVAGAFLAVLLFPDIGFSGPGSIVAMGICVGIAVIVGDLVESGFKRSAGVKDSGVIVPGRGGLLDSFDSLLFAAPVFFLLARVMGLFPAV